LCYLCNSTVEAKEHLSNKELEGLKIQDLIGSKSKIYDDEIKTNKSMVSVED
jgi:hypothetical protein